MSGEGITQQQVEWEKTLILGKVGQEGQRCLESLIVGYCGETVVREAAIELAVNSNEGFLRKMMFTLIEQAGMIEGITGISALIDPAGKADPSEETRMAVLNIIDSALARANGAGSTPADGKLGEALVNCALFDPSEKMWRGAAGILGRSADRVTLANFMTQLHKAEAQKNEGLARRGKEALLEMIMAMRKTRMRGTVITALVNLAAWGGEAGRLAFDHVVELGKSNTDVQDHLLIESARMGMEENCRTEIELKRLRAIGAIIAKMEGRVREEPAEDGKASGFKRDKRREMAGGAEVKPTRNMRPAAVPAEKDEGYVHVPGDWIGNFFRRRAYNRERKLEREAAAARQKNPQKIRRER